MAWRNWGPWPRRSWESILKVKFLVETRILFDKFIRIDYDDYRKYWRVNFEKINETNWNRKIAGVLLTAMMFTMVVPSAFATSLQSSEAAEKDFDSYSMGEIETILVNYLDEAYPELEIGTPAFYDFAIEELLGDGDEQLQNHKDYRLIRVYLAEYKLEYEDFLICQSIVESTDASTQSTLNTILDDNDSIVYHESESISFALSSSFNTQTIGDIKAENAAKEAAAAANENITLPTALSGYDRYAAAAYGSYHGDHYNTDEYPTYGSDCCNFVSQCLVAGGISMQGTTSSAGIVDSTTKWYC